MREVDSFSVALQNYNLRRALSVRERMPNFLKFIALAIPVFGIGIFMSYRDYGEAERMAFQGHVSYIDWQSSNHGMPLIEVSRSNGTKAKFSSTRIILDSTQLKVGDSLAKIGGSKSCTINEKSVPCIK